ncbi:MAG: aspartyl/asparaginyl beta-hydroxylase domain-containing protein [Planctomycetes bacterium]|nr:aspartyl/asparaginyl beta-hydroxylase domain-containing protein [Planctomycetota bacterium]MCB9916792.1 aspartyl/asparaginyl beta-hydroxylase domain-containing protein [Planctomycetota bacterium]
MLDGTQFEFVAAIESRYSTFKADALQLSPDEFVRWPNHEAYQGDWRVFPFLTPKPVAGVTEFCEPNRRRCPKTAVILDSFPEIVGAGFSRMAPGCHIYPHVDDVIPNVLRVHLGLVTDETSKMRIDGQIISWSEGKAIVFDGRVQHETANLGKVPRTILIVDFDPTFRELPI